LFEVLWKTFDKLFSFRCMWSHISCWVESWKVWQMHWTLQENNVIKKDWLR